eukprot:CAMPEP_0117655088 /NCGR_PEP_ID=MMETSP0804-20121206/4094_1 /TAXON_ID=1074897 /ORGANISM="Tetraselmis astigmatica, Strain CCMP880" /LENGTH=89 /DNA_ID=CAMNT_0005461419 /DNA_START=140 /DNA_END=406 /DNA_ORIENTATION=+
MKKPYRGNNEDLLKWGDSEGGQKAQARHVSKRKRASSGAEVVFDPVHHKAFLTGFSKRKKQRRKEAMKNLEKLERQDRLEQRAERRRIK